MQNQTLFSWIPFYEEVADLLLSWRSRQTELIGFLNRLREQGEMLPELEDRGADDIRFPLKEIDPFTVFALFNRGIRVDKRIRLASAIGRELGATSPPPTDFAGIPVVNNQKTWFFAYSADRSENDIPALWTVFEKALGSKPLEDPDFREAFDTALRVKGVRFNLTMGLFWIRPQTFLSLDSVLQSHAHLAVKGSQLSSATYIGAVRKVSERPISFPQLSYNAWLASGTTPGTELDSVSLPDEAITDPEDVPVFWFVGAYWDGDDQTSRFLDQGVWENGYDDRFLDDVKSMRVGEKIAIKAAFTRKNELPFESSGKSASVMAIKAIGTILSNPGTGKHVLVSWEKRLDKGRNWYFYTNRQTVWGLRRGVKPYNDYLIDFTFFGLDQDYSWFLRQPYWAKWLNEDIRSGVIAEELDERIEEETITPTPESSPYGVDDILKEGVFLPRAEIERLVALLRNKKNLILQGPPGVGKTFVAQKVAFAMLGVRDSARVTRVQFHQSMSYEDFVRGLRPKRGGVGFDLVDGPFLDVAEAARASPNEQEHVLIIEEINRGNPSGIFGELLTLLESDKRDSENAIRLTNHRSGESDFYIPHNMYVIGTMNLADRSLAVLDRALRRRFVFAELGPLFGEAFVAWCCAQGIDRGFISDVASRVGSVNELIEADDNLGKNSLIGHSYFCPKSAELATGSPTGWYREVVTTQILPLLEDYWYDDHPKITEASGLLLDGVP